MNKQVARALKQKDIKLLPIDPDLEKIIEELSSELETDPVDVVAAAIDILQKCIGRRITIRKPNSKVELEVRTFETYKPIINFEND